ncbi:MAG: HAMP domain-containing protein [Ferruginibacter sp.]|nr:HAMP domain-containing protein [Ferruginibacter sp.]
MPVRIKITLLFTMIVFLLLSLLCTSVYYFSYSNRVENVKSRLLNRALTTASLLNQSETFDEALINKIDASTAMSMNNKTVQAYNYFDVKIYTYADNPGDTIHLDTTILDEARKRKLVFFAIDQKEALAWCDVDNQSGIVIVAAAYDEEGRKYLERLQLILLFSFTGGIFIAIASGYFFSRGLLLPIRKITDEVNIISAKNLTHRIKSGHANDEWNNLTATLNELLNRLEESFEIQRRFISNASHELSTPLTSISSQLEIALQRERGAGEYRKVMLSVYQDVRHLSKLTQTLLEFAKASGTPGGIEIDLVRVDEVLMLLPAEMKKINKSWLVQLDFDQLPEQEEQLLVFGNAILLFAAIKNIVSNACKYSDDHLARVKLFVRLKQIIIVIADEGKGIDEAEIQNIFQPFYRADNSRSITGFGLGLSLASRFIKLHKGEISVQSVLNKGTAFTITLPVAADSAAV